MSEVRYSVLKEDDVGKLFAAVEDVGIFEFDGSKFVPLTSAVDFFDSTPVSEEEAMCISSGVRSNKRVEVG